MTQKELKEAYKQKKFKMGVFQIRNTVNNKIFVEGSVNLDAIWNRHRLELNFGNHRCEPLLADWKTFGEQNFVFEILGEIEPEDGKDQENKKEVKLLEQMYLEELQPYDEKGYNRRPKA
jgi:hypothetical protein